MLVDTPESRKEAHRLLEGGRLEEARAAYEGLVAAAPGDADLVGRLARVALMQERAGEAEALLRRSLGLDGEARVRLRNLYDLGMLLRRSGRAAEAVELVRAAAPDWPAAAPAGPARRNMALWLVDTLISAGETARARRVLDRALPERSGDADALALDGRLCLDEDAADRAVRAGYALCRLGAHRAAHAMVHHIARRWPAYVDPPRASHRATILITNAASMNVNALSGGLRLLHAYGNFPAEFARKMQDAYRFAFAFADLPEDDFPARLPEADLILNNLTNGELLQASGVLDLLRARLARTGLPVINHPDHAAQTTRLNNARLLAGVPNLKVPRLEHHRTDEAPVEDIVAGIGERFGYPVIVRLPWAQQSSYSLRPEAEKSALLIPDAAALREHLQGSGWRDFYAVEFVDLKRDDGIYRKVRAVMIDHDIIVKSAAMYRDWMVTGWRSRPEGIAFYRENPHTIEECNRIVLDPETQLGTAAMRTLEAIRDRIPLDMFGIDFDVDREGRVVFFEATAAMIFSGNSAKQPADVRQPEEPRIRVEDAFHRLVARRKAERQG